MVAETNENRRMGQKLERKIAKGYLGPLYLTKALGCYGANGAGTSESYFYYP